MKCLRFQEVKKTQQNLHMKALTKTEQKRAENKNRL